MLKVSFLDHLVAVVQCLSSVVKIYLLDTLEATFLAQPSSNFGQNVCLDKISNEFKFGSPAGLIN